MTYKRYEYWSSKGKQWTEWFPWDSSEKPQWQLKNRLRNEYKDS